MSLTASANRIADGSLRTAIVEYLRRELAGPVGGDREELSPDPPNERYVAGLLFPQRAGEGSDEPAPEEVLEPPSDDIAQADMLTLANRPTPSSMGLSVLLGGDRPALEVVVTGATYENLETQKRRHGPWRRRPLGDEHGRIVLALQAPLARRETTRHALAPGLALHVVWRQGEAGWLATFTLVNDQTYAPGCMTGEQLFFQIGLRVEVAAGTRIRRYRHQAFRDPDQEERLLGMLYRHDPTFGVGHGCAIDWDAAGPGESPRAVWTEVVPTHIVRPQVYDVDGLDPRALSWYVLAGEAGLDDAETLDLLRGFVDAYAAWIDALLGHHPDLGEADAPEVGAVLATLHETRERLRRGIEVLAYEPDALEAFRLANRAMLLQRAHGSPEAGGTRRKRGERAYQAPALRHDPGYRWRPFQLAYLLLNIEPLVEPQSAFRDVVDLIWFPTGGGKTEAYLGVSAFTLFLRRLTSPSDGGGTAILMRYTLRLLTAQQFQRAASLICACEVMRRDAPERFGAEPFSLGLWVGGGVTPNSCAQAFRRLEALVGQRERENPFQLARCPWCGTEIVPAAPDAPLGDYGLEATEASFRFRCRGTGCPFTAVLPVQVVDEEIYRAPPSMLVGTVDKFAAIPWYEETGALFGRRAGARPSVRPPELIIQDELHLISGPLGTLVGLYETAIDALCEHGGQRPKVIASTATIRQAEQQCRGLYDRRVAQFPPPGLSADDSFFARTDPSGAGRMYVGVMPAGTSSTNASVRTAAALLQAPFALGFTPEELDAYFTLTWYQNSLRELGQGLTLANDGIPEHIKLIGRGDPAGARVLRADAIEELTSNVAGTRLPGVLERLERTCHAADPVSLLLCTNMLSVGVDVARLGLMLVNAQPKSTSEYIQATSRVGRGLVPGLVVVQYNALRPRDRSHYESFKGYHGALYRYVEPTSVTPFAPPARARGLHAVLVSLVRHQLGLAANGMARHVRDARAGIEALIDLIGRRVRSIDPREVPDTLRQLEDLLREWEARAAGNLHYSARQGGKGIQTLLCETGSENDGWETLRSMRHVDHAAAMWILYEDE